MEKRLVDLTKTDVLEDSDYLFVNHGDNPVQVSFPFIKEQIAPNDTTLSESGKFADAKVVGDKLNEHSQSIETINTEIEAIKADYATKEEAETKTHAEETFATKASLSFLQEDLNGVKEDYLTKQEDQENRDTEFYEGRKYNGMTYAGKTSDKGVQLHSVKGKTVQQTTNGYQLFDASKLATKSQGGATVTNNGDGSFTISGSGNLTESIYLFIADVTSEVLPLLKEGTIFCKFDKTSYPYCVFKLMDSSGTLILQLNNRNETSSSQEITEDILSKTVKVCLQFYGENGGIIQTGTIKPMVYQDGDGTWEPYTGGKPAPNPDYPMEIENVEIREITSQSKNLFDKNSVAKTRVTFNGKEFVFDPTNEAAILTMPIDTKYIKNGNKFYVSFYAKIEGTLKQVYSDLFPDALSNDLRFDVTEEYKKVSGYLTVRDDKQTNPKFRIYINTSATTKLYVKDVMLSFGEESEYLPYGHNTVETSLTLAEGDTYENGQITRVRKQITFDGSSDEAWGNIDSQNGYGKFYINLPNAPILNTENIENILSNIFEIKNNISYWSNPSENCISHLASSEKGRIGVVFDGATDLTSFKSWLSTHNLVVEYELATPTTEELKIPTVPSYYPYTEVSTDNTLETDITWKVLADCDNSLKQEELEQRILALETKAIE